MPGRLKPSFKLMYATAQREVCQCCYVTRQLEMVYSSSRRESAFCCANARKDTLRRVCHPMRRCLEGTSRSVAVTKPRQLDRDTVAHTSVGDRPFGEPNGTAFDNRPDTAPDICNEGKVRHLVEFPWRPAGDCSGVSTWLSSFLRTLRRWKTQDDGLPSPRVAGPHPLAMLPGGSPIHPSHTTATWSRVTTQGEQ